MSNSQSYPVPEAKDRKHVIVTGGAGFIGSHLVERLLREGKSVVIIDDFSTGSVANLQTIANETRLQVIQSRVSDCKELPALTASAECIYHLAAAVGVELVLRSPVQTIQTNLHETEAILEAASLHKVPTLLTSTSEVYGKSRQPILSEEDDLLIGPPSLGRWSYACSKLMDEFLAMAYAQERGLPVIIARLFNTVGPRQTGRYGMVLPRFIAAARTGHPLRVFGDGRQARCFCYVEDAVEALVRLQNCAGAKGNVFNIGGSEEISIADLARRVITVLRSSSSVEFVSYEKAYPSGFEDMQRRRPVTDKLERMVGFKPMTALDTIIQKTAAAFP